MGAPGARDGGGSGGFACALVMQRRVRREGSSIASLDDGIVGGDRLCGRTRRALCSHALTVAQDPLEGANPLMAAGRVRVAGLFFDVEAGRLEREGGVGHGDEGDGRELRIGRMDWCTSLCVEDSGWCTVSGARALQLYSGEGYLLASNVWASRIDAGAVGGVQRYARCGMRGGRKSCRTATEGEGRR